MKRLLLAVCLTLQVPSVLAQSGAPTQVEPIAAPGLPLPAP
jgi:hypothetical protein